jgi:hypothetical protein
MFGSNQTGPRPNPSIPNMPSSNAAQSSTGSDLAPVHALLVILAIYVIWAFIAAHEKVRSSVEPKNIGINLWNLGVIAFTVVLSINLAKIALTKLAGWGVPGAQSALTVVANT